jgi:hypothetical protein
MKKKLLYLIFGVLLPATAFSQKGKQHEKDTNKGFEIFFNAGMYWGSKYNANYFQGYPDPVDNKDADPNIGYVMGNKFWRDDIWNLIYEKNHSDIIDTFFNFEGVSEMRYNLAFAFGVGLRYRFSESFTMSFLFSQVGLTAEGVATFGMNGRGVNLDQGIMYLPYKVMGKERRIFLEMNASYLFETIYPYIFPFLELGVHLNNVKVLKSELIVEERAFSMIDVYGGMSYVPGIDHTVINPYLGGIGYGFMGGLGVRIAFNKWAAIEPVFQVSTEKLNLSSYGKMRPNFNFLIRLVVGDKMFAKKQE